MLCPPRAIRKMVHTYSNKQPVNPPETEAEEDDGSWCYCKTNKGGNMIGCDNESCPIQWFHQECVQMSAVLHCTVSISMSCSAFLFL